MGNSYNVNSGGGKGASDGFREGPKGPQKAKAPSYKEGPNPNASVPKLKQIGKVAE